MTKNNIKNLIVSVVSVTLVLVLAFVFAGKAYADCKATYGGGETCTNEIIFKVKKEVRLAGTTEWKDKIINVKMGDVIEFRIRIKNIGDVSVNGMEMKDKLPADIFKKIGGDGLTEEWDSFDPGDTKEFVITVKVKDSEFTSSRTFDKCVVNKAEAYYDGDFVGSATATVCYSNKTVTELPKTGLGNSVTLTIAGFGLVGLGLLIKKSKVLA